MALLVARRLDLSSLNSLNRLDPLVADKLNIHAPILRSNSSASSPYHLDKTPSNLARNLAASEVSPMASAISAINLVSSAR